MLKPILFNTEMVQAILDKRKSVEGRVIKPKPTQPIPLGFTSFSTCKKNIGCYSWGKHEYGGIIDNRKPRYKIGDILWVQETWCYGSDTVKILFDPEPMAYDVLYRADYKHLDKDEAKWRSPTHMPKEIARIFLKVTYVRVERLQHMAGYQVEKEGLRFVNNPLIYQDTATFTSLARHKYKALWNSTVKKKDLDKYGWDANPWVWVIDFERISKEEALNA